MLASYSLQITAQCQTCTNKILFLVLSYKTYSKLLGSVTNVETLLNNFLIIQSYKSKPQYDKSKLLLLIGKSEISWFLNANANANQL